MAKARSAGQPTRPGSTPGWRCSAPATDERVLDVGCGAGASSLALAARFGAGGQLLGVDISEPLIARARALAPQDTPVLFRVADASSAELPEGAGDSALNRSATRFTGRTIVTTTVKCTVTVILDLPINLTREGSHG